MCVGGLGSVRSGSWLEEVLLRDVDNCFVIFVFFRGGLRNLSHGSSSLVQPRAGTSNCLECTLFLGGCREGDCGDRVTHFPSHKQLDQLA